MDTVNANIVDELNRIVSANTWFDFTILSYQKGNLEIGGSIDLLYGYTLKITFVDVFFISMAADWKTDTRKPFLYLLSSSRYEFMQINVLYQIEMGYEVFKIQPEDAIPYYVAAKSINFHLYNGYQPL